VALPRCSRKPIKLTKSVVDHLPLVTGAQVLYWDSELPGFGLCVGATSKSYLVQRTLGGRGPRRQTVRITIGKHGVFTAEEARRQARDLLNRLARGEDPREDQRIKNTLGLTLGQAWAQCCGARPLAAKTRKEYGRALERDLVIWLDRPLSSITGAEVVERYTYLREQLGPSAAARTMRVFRAVYNFALQLHDHLPANPADRLKKLRLWYRDPRRRTYIRPDQLPNWYAAVMRLPNDSARDYLRLLLFTGMRKSEALALPWDQIDLMSRTLAIPETKNGDPLVLPLSDFLLYLLSARRARFPKAEWVFPGEDPSRHLAEPKKWVYAVRRSGVEFTLHDLRRTFITVAESLDLSAYTLKRLLNHRDGGRDVTAGYIVLDVERLRKPMQRITDHLLNICGAPPGYDRLRA
jgi:integrase